MSEGKDKRSIRVNIIEEKNYKERGIGYFFCDLVSLCLFTLLMRDSHFLFKPSSIIILLSSPSVVDS